MSVEGFDPGQPQRRGRRDPELAARLALDPTGDDAFVDAGEEGPEGGNEMVIDGDVVVAKVTHSVEFDGQPSWFTYGLQSRVLPGETEEDTFVRVATVVNTRVLDLAADAEDRIAALRGRNAREARRLPRR